MPAHFRAPLTLRLRLVGALVALVTVGLSVFMVTMYGLYARAQYSRLDDQLRDSVSLVAAQLRSTAGLDGGNASHASAPSDSDGPGGDGGGSKGGGGGHETPPLVVPPGTYAALIDASGTTLATIQLSDGSAVPNVPDPLPANGHVFTTGSASGSGEWRVVVSTDRGGPGGSSSNTVIVAIPTTEVSDALHRLVLIGVGSAGGLLVILGLGSWLILRHGLRPIEQMATTARSITAGALDQRVTPDDPNSEVGQLGLAINTMLSELEDAFRERDETEQRLRQFLADASHELRTPLTSIQGFAELFRLGASDQEHVDLPVIMRRIEEESARMKTLVEDLLLLARLDQTRATERVPVDLAVLAADACSDAVAAAPDRPVTLDAPEPAVVLGDRDHLRQAIANLVTNALRHTPKGTLIAVSVRIAGENAVLEVRDHGDGLDADALQHVFDRFWQADHARVGEGAGLGLAIVAGIAREHGGQASAVNVEGGGAAFTLTIPMERVASTSPEQSERSPRLS